MCGRYSLTSAAYEEFLDFLGGDFSQSLTAPVSGHIPDRYNIAPMQPIPVIRLKGSDQDQAIIPDQALPEKEAALMQWGLVPSWAKEMSRGRPLINARSETIAQKPSFRGPFRRRKCLVPANGFYEWKRSGLAKGASPRAFHCRLPDKTPFAFGGIWEIWMGPHGEDWLETVSLITKEAIPLMRPVHHRSPVIIDPADYDDWLRPKDPPDADIFRRLSTQVEENMQIYNVSDFVNNARNDGPKCNEPAVGNQFRLF